MLFNVLWFVLAGFVLGFATSLLWEWLYFRKRRFNWRNREVIRLENQVNTLQDQLDQRAGEFSSAQESTTTMGRSGTQPGDFQSSAARLESEQTVSMPQARRTKGQSRTTMPAAMPTAMPGESKGDRQSRSAPPNAAAQGQAVSAEVLTEQHQSLREKPAQQKVENRAATGAVGQAASRTSQEIRAVNQEIGAFSVDSLIANGGNEPLESEQADEAIATEQAPPHVPSLEYRRAEQKSNNTQARLASVTAVQPDSLPRIDAQPSPQQDELLPQQPNEAPPSSSVVEPTESAHGIAAQVEDNSSANLGFIQDAYADSAPEVQPEIPYDGDAESFSAFGIAQAEVDVTQADLPQAAFDPSTRHDDAGSDDTAGYTEVGYTEVDYSGDDYSDLNNDVQDSEESSSALERYDDLFGQPTDEQSAAFLHQEIAGRDEPSEQRDVTPHIEEGDVADVDFYNAQDNADLPTVSGVIAATQHEPLLSDPHPSEPAVDPPSDPPRKGNSASKDQTFESTVALPAAMANRSDTPIIKLARHNGLSKIRGIRKAEIEYPDDLTKIKGIGPKFQERLYASGIYTWDQLSKSKPEVVEAATQPRINEDVTEWITQARSVAREHNRIGATYSGPTPNDLSQINGLSSATMLKLYHNGITSFAQLAKAKKSTLTNIFDGSSNLDFSGWVKEAKKLSRTHH